MGSGFYMPLDIAKTLMATRYILFARYAIKFALIHLRFRNWKFSHSFLFKLRLAHFHTIGILLCFFCRWYKAISSTFRCHCVSSLKDTQIYYTFEMLFEFIFKRKLFHQNRTGEKIILLDRPFSRWGFTEKCVS